MLSNCEQHAMNPFANHLDLVRCPWSATGTSYIQTCWGIMTACSRSTAP